MEKLFQEKIRLFIGGSAIGGIAGFRLFIDGIPVGGNLVWAYTIKFFGTIILAFVSGLFTVVAHDFYKHKIKDRLFKNKKESNNEENKK